MNVKKTLIFFVIFVILAFGVWYSERPFESKSSTKESEAVEPLFKGFSEEDAVKITVNQIPEQSSVIEKINGKWLVTSENNFPANQKEIDEVFKKIKEFDTSELVSKNPENQGTFQVNKIGIEVIVEGDGGKKLAHFFVGKNGPSYMNTYLRADGSDNVYLQKGFLKSAFDKSKSRWKNRDILKVEKESIDRISYLKTDESGKATEYVLNKTVIGEEISWNIESPEQHPAKTDEVERILSTATNFMADDFSDKTPAETGLENPTQWFEVGLKDGMKYRILFGSKDEKQYFTALDPAEAIYKISEYKFTNIMKDLEAIKSEEPKTVEPEIAPEPAE